MEGTPNFLTSLHKADASFVFLGGIHGVGKTTACRRLFIPAGYRCVTASSLIKAYGDSSDENKRVENVANNQAVLIEQLAFEKTHHNHLLLDGHYCLINSVNKFEPIDIDIFRMINPCAFILLKGCPSEITQRLKNRDGKNWDQPFVEQFQMAEEQHAQYISHELNIPLHVISYEEDQ
ncbi:ATP-binding protein [Pontiella sulfatireligans]|uniref:ATP-binding protein n=1 Tax=Pontiella sulfatireligans TaxID=2750658 RepID=UPI00109C4C5C|nr:ATP-binding protein [Pontiella sulfatireligans]